MVDQPMASLKPSATSPDRKPRNRVPLRAAPWVAALAIAALWTRLRTGKAAPAGAPPCLTPEQFEAREPYRGRGAHYPWAIPPRGWKDILWRTYQEFGRTRLPALAGGVTFYLLLAIFPAVAAFVSLYGLYSNVDTVERELVHMSEFFPQEAVDLIGDQMLRLASQRHGTLGAAFAVSALVSVWSANAGMKALFDAVNVAYNETEKRPYVQRTLITYGATFAALLFMVSVTAVGVAVPVMFHKLGLAHHGPWWVPLRWVVIWLIAALAFTLIYRFGPSRAAARWRWVAAGGATAALLWMGGSLGFSWYLNTFTHLGVTYGSLGAMIGLMLWVWFSVILVLVGAEFNAEIEHQTACDTTCGAPKPLGARGAVMADTVGPAFTISPREAWDLSVAFLGRQVGYVTSFFRRLARV
jgi:membrane protein